MQWTRDQLTAMGCSNAHLEDWGEFGMGWRQLNTWVRMSAPDTAVFIAQALPWSASSHGPVNGAAIWVNAKDEKDLEKYKGKLAGKIVFFGDMRDVKPVDKPLFERRDEANLKTTVEYPVHVGEQEDFFASFIKRLEFREKAGAFFAAEHAAGIVVPSRDGRNNGGSGGTIFDDGGGGMGWFTYQREHAEPLPIVVMAIESYGRVYRLLKANVPVSVEMDVETEFTGDHEHGFDTIAEIPGTDPKLKDEVVMVGGHLDSWASATGATDNGAGTIVAMEVMRILNSLARAAAAHDPRWVVDGGRAGRIWVLRIRQAAFWIRPAFNYARAVEAAGLSAQAGGSGGVEAGAAENFRIFQSG